MFKKIFAVFTYLLSLLFPTKESLYVKNHMIDIDFIPVNIYWIDDSNVLLTAYGETVLYNTSNRNRNMIETCDRCIYGYDKGWRYCKYEHRVISSMEEFSTTISLYDIEKNLLYERDVFPTIVPYECTKQYILLRSAYSFLEQKEYRLDTLEDSLEEFIPKEETILFNGIPKDVKVLSTKDDLEKVIVLDEYNRVWIYLKK